MPVSISSERQQGFCNYVILPFHIKFYAYIICILIVISRPVETKATPASTVNAVAKSNWLAATGKQCNIHENETLHAVMDRVCELCHDMFSHQNPNMRAQCRSDCFRSEHFRKCLLLFRPSRASRHNRTRHLMF